MASIPPQFTETGAADELWTSAENVSKQILGNGNEIPGPGMWKANLPPELKKLIRERGFPAMLAALAARFAVDPNEQ